jgi:hypothetical protein
MTDKEVMPTAELRRTVDAQPARTDTPVPALRRFPIYGLGGLSRNVDVYTAVEVDALIREARELLVAAQAKPELMQRAYEWSERRNVWLKATEGVK